MCYSKLRGKIKEVYGTQGKFAEAMQMDRSTLSLKLAGKSEWSRDEVETACILLKIPIDEVHEYFFYSVSLENQTN